MKRFFVRCEKKPELSKLEIESSFRLSLSATSDKSGKSSDSSGKRPAGPGNFLTRVRFGRIELEDFLKQSRTFFLLVSILETSDFEDTFGVDDGMGTLKTSLAWVIHRSLSFEPPGFGSKRAAGFGFWTEFFVVFFE